MPGLDIFLSLALTPVEPHRIRSGIGDYELCAVDCLVIVPGAESDAFDAFVNIGSVNPFAENPYYLILRTMLQQKFRQVSRVAGILTVVIRPAHHSSFLDRDEKLETRRKGIGETIFYPVEKPGQFV